MPKIGREDYQKRINDLEIDNDIKTSLMEDLADSWIDESEEIGRLEEEITRVKEEYDSLNEKYRSRFFESVDPKKEPEEVKEKEEKDEEKVIDIKEI